MPRTDLHQRFARISARVVGVAEASGRGVHLQRAEPLHQPAPSRGTRLEHRVRGFCEWQGTSHLRAPAEVLADPSRGRDGGLTESMYIASISDSKRFLVTCH